MSLVNLTINGKAVSVPADTMILEAAKQVNIKILVFLYKFFLLFKQARNALYFSYKISCSFLPFTV